MYRVRDFFKSMLKLSVVVICTLYLQQPCAVATPSAIDPAKKPTDQKELSQMVGPDFEKEPTFISANSLALQAKTRKFEYQGKVEVKHADLTLNSDNLEGYYDQNNQIQKLIAKSNVLITKGDTIKASSQKATYQRSDQTLLLSENPQLEQSGNILSADQIRIYLKDNRSEAIGTVRVKVVNSGELSDLPGVKKASSDTKPQ